MYLPQFTLTLRLVDVSTLSRRRRSPVTNDTYNQRDGADDRTWVLVEDEIENAANQIIVFVIVDDINDNYPIFKQTDILVGYPARNLALEILPPYLTKVQVST